MNLSLTILYEKYRKASILLVYNIPLPTILKLFDIPLGFGQDILLNVDGDPYFVEFVVRGTNFRMRITSNYSRGIYFTELISRYIRCDTRVLPLLRLFRFFTKVSCIFPNV